ncbi:hypothetical protein Tco_0965695 [Tanacetum coccineum]
MVSNANRWHEILRAFGCSICPGTRMHWLVVVSLGYSRGDHWRFGVGSSDCDGWFVRLHVICWLFGCNEENSTTQNLITLRPSQRRSKMLEDIVPEENPSRKINGQKVAGKVIKEELESVERQAEEERDAHNATKMVDRVYIGSPHMVRVFDHENRRAFLIQKEGLPDADNLLITIQEKIKWADTMSELDKKHKKENEERFEEANNVLSTSNILFILPAVTYLLFGKFVAGWHTPNTQVSFSNDSNPSLGDNVKESHKVDQSSSSFYIVRDDLLHPLVNGNKARELDALLKII